MPKPTVPTLEDVAQLANVSTATVSRCMNSPDRVQKQTRERVLDAVRELGYYPNFGARALMAKSTNTIGAIIPTRYDGRRLLDRELVLTLREEYGESTKVTDPIREGIAARDATRSAMPVGQYDPKSNPAKDYARVFGSLIGEA